MKRERPGHRVLLYCNRAFWRTHDTSGYAGDGLWIADYVAAGKPRIEASWRIHQYTDDPLDRNVADFGSVQALRDWATAG
ncbi:Hydrolase OS=Streptomyces microflavus OX=1919 GN=Smic_00020 PE=3 SV=1 [Streptomyces microflavus]